MTFSTETIDTFLDICGHNADDRSASLHFVSKWSKGDHSPILPQKWADLRDGDICNCCFNKDIDEVDAHLLIEMHDLLEYSLTPEALKVISFVDACSTFVKLAETLEAHVEPDEDDDDDEEDF
jgi:hypothetical protein